jgi:hypothetical protein
MPVIESVKIVSARCGIGNDSKSLLYDPFRFDTWPAEESVKIEHVCYVICEDVTP